MHSISSPSPWKPPQRVLHVLSLPVSLTRNLHWSLGKWGIHFYWFHLPSLKVGTAVNFPTQNRYQPIRMPLAVMMHQCTGYILVGYYHPCPNLLLKPLLPHCCNRNITVCSTRLLWGLTEITRIKHPAHYFAHSWLIEFPLICVSQVPHLQLKIILNTLFYFIGKWWRRPWQFKFSLPPLCFQPLSFCLQGKQSPSKYCCHFKTILWKCSLLGECGTVKGS